MAHSVVPCDHVWVCATVLFELKIYVLVSRTNITSVNLVCSYVYFFKFKQEIDASILTNADTVRASRILSSAQKSAWLP